MNMNNQEKNSYVREHILDALLDMLEDTDTTIEELFHVFGPRVAVLVKEESEDRQEDKADDSNWKERKLATLEHLERAGYETKLLAMADKLSNIRAIQRDLKAYTEKGETFWSRFHQMDSAMHGWYYSSIARILLADPRLKETQACKEYAERVQAVFGTGC